ncbi:MAG: SulP family inorganic anion transporter [Rhodospirillales bacterium]|nr:SulP family inorganic anion transporter [Rhodospirillales bacterium]
MTTRIASAVRALASELRADAGSAMLPAALSTGLITAVIVLMGEAAIASIIFSGPLAPLVPRGTGAILFGTVVMCFLTALACTYKGTISVPHFAPAAVLLTIGAAVAAVMASASGEAVFATMIVIVGLSTVATAICYLLIGWFGLAHLFRFMPYPLVGGFLAGIGWFLVKSSVAVASGITMTWEALPALGEIDTIQKWAPGVFYGALLLVVTKIRPHYLILPVSAVVAIGVCHATLFALDIPLAEATASGLLFAGIPAGSAWPPIGLDDLALVDWGVVTSQLPGILAVMLVAIISLVFCAGGLELISGVEINLNREFRAEGVSSLLAGLGGSAPGCNSIPNSAVSHATGAETRLTGITVAVIVGLILFVGGDVLALLPTPVLGGLVLFVGLNLLYEVLVSNRKTLPWLDYGIVLAVSLVIVFVGFLEGVAVGLAAAVIFFVVRFSKVSVVEAAFTLRERRSKRTRSATHHAILRHWGERVQAYRLRGYVIFGNAAAIGDRLGRALKTDPPPLCVLLDFAQVSGFDSSAANVMGRAVRAAHARGTRIVLSAAAEHVRSILHRGLPAPLRDSLILVEDLDRALERCEDLVIAEWDRQRGDSDEAREELFGLSFDHAMRDLDRQARFEALLHRLAPWLETRSYDAGEVMVARDEVMDGMLLVTEGRTVAREDDTGSRVEEYGPGDALAPEAALAPHVSRTPVIAAVPCRAALMTPAAREALERDDLALVVELDRYLIETMSAD